MLRYFLEGMEQNLDKFEDNIIHKLNHISEEDMAAFLDNMNPAEFECSPKLKSEIEDIVMSETNLKKSNKKILLYGKIAACAAVAMSVGFVATNESAKASLAKLFAFAPKQGVVEVAPDDAMYQLNQIDTKVSASDLDLGLISAYTLNDKLTVEYQAVLKGTNLSEIEGILEPGANQNQLTLDYVIEKGYGKYFDFEGVDTSDLKNIYTKPISSVSVNDTEYKGQITNVEYDTEAFMNWGVRITEVYDVPKDVYKNMESASLTLGDVTTTFTLGETTLEETATEAVEQGFIIEKDNIKLRLEPTWTKDYLYIDTYVLSSGDFSYVNGYEHPYPSTNEGMSKVLWINDYPGICLMADGKMIEPEGEPSNMEDPEKHEMFGARYKFDLEGYENCNEFTLKINGVNVVRKDETITVPFGVQDEEKVYDVYNAHLKNVYTYYDAGDSRFPMLDCEIVQESDDILFTDFANMVVNGENMVLSEAYYVKSFPAEIKLERK